MSGLGISAGTLTGTVADLPAATLAAAFGSIASALRCLCDVRFTPKSGHVRCKADVRFVPIADMIRPSLGFGTTASTEINSPPAGGRF